MTDESVPAAHSALQAAKQGRMPSHDMLAQLVAGQLHVPVFETPRIEKGVIAGWRPSSASKADGSQWLIAFTLQDYVAAYCDAHPDQGLYMTIDTRWVLGNIPDDWGIVFNLRTQDVLEWNAQGLQKYRKNVLGW